MKIHIPTTYESGLLQAKAYRLLKNYTSAILAPYNLTTAEWALLGHLYDTGELKLREIASLLSVEAPLVTNMVDQLEKNGYAKRINHPTDRRARYVTLTDKGRKSIPEIEKVVKKAVKKMLKGVSILDLLAYMRVVRHIVENTEAHEPMFRQDNLYKS